MPNHVTNILTAVGDEAAVNRFVAAARGKMPTTGDPPGNRNFCGTREIPVEPFCFHSLVPLPKEYGRVPYDSGAGRCGYKMEVEAWGVKWGAYEHKEPLVESGVATWHFRTPRLATSSRTPVSRNILSGSARSLRQRRGWTSGLMRRCSRRGCRTRRGCRDLRRGW